MYKCRICSTREMITFVVRGISMLLIDMHQPGVDVKPIVTIENLNARAENGSLLSIKGFVVINAEDQSIINKNGNILTTLPYKPKFDKISLFFT